ncbi:MAG TPA: VapE family protein [Saprospiraceae bacterium]|nr:VapE family protein [Saprospiraceae bacterium]HMQ83461.1 VapE family protein [Saprospiraceae bacterium]
MGVNLHNSPISPIVWTGEKMQAPVTLFKGCLKDSQPKGVSTIGEILTLIRDDNKEPLKALYKELRNLHDEAPDKYKAKKEAECPAFIIGQFSERKNEALKKYVPLLGFDIDHIGSEAFVPGVIKQLSQNPYTFAAYASPSGSGVRFLVWCDSTPEAHKTYYEAITAHFSEFLNIPTDKALRSQLKADGLDTTAIGTELKKRELIDTGTNNLARLWFYTWIPDDCFFVNEHSQTFYLKPEQKTFQRPPHHTQTTEHRQPLTDERKIDVCLDKVSRQSIPSGRNNFVFAFACEMARHGVSQVKALKECLAYVGEDFSEAEIKKSVASAYQSKSIEFQDGQILKYEALTKGLESNEKTTKKRRKNGDAMASTPAIAEPAREKQKTNTAPDDETQNKFLRIKNYISKRYDLRLNVVANEIEISHKAGDDFQILNENDLLCELLEAGFNGVEKLLIALLRSSFVPLYDPFQQYFENLPIWKPTDPDYITELANYIEAKDQHWFNAQFKKMLVRVVACSLNVIPFNKQCFVLKGEQNDGKSTFIRYLCPPKLKSYITDHIDPNNKDGRLTLCQNLIINLDELSQFSFADIRKVKSLITLDSVKERLPYDRKPTTIKRRASLWGSTNDDEFLIDETGNVRWLVMEIQKHGVKHDNGGENGYNQIDIDLVYSQAYALLKSGFPFEMTKEEIARSERNNQSFQMTSVEQELIQEFFSPEREDEEGAEFVTATDVMKAIEGEVKTTIHTRTIGRAMKLLNFEKVQRYSGTHGYQVKGYWVRRLKKE